MTAVQLRILRKTHAKRLECQTIRLEFVHQRAGVYVSDESQAYFVVCHLYAPTNVAVLRYSDDRLVILHGLRKITSYDEAG